MPACEFLEILALTVMVAQASAGKFLATIAPTFVAAPESSRSSGSRGRPSPDFARLDLGGSIIFPVPVRA